MSLLRCIPQATTSAPKELARLRADTEAAHASGWVNDAINMLRPHGISLTWRERLPPEVQFTLIERSPICPAVRTHCSLRYVENVVAVCAAMDAAWATR